MASGDTERWKERALAAEEQLRELRERFLALALILPPEYLGYLEGEGAALDETAGALDVLSGWDDTPFMTPSHVAEEMERLWNRLSPRNS